ncbi:hypothetical protein APHAL10511_003352 [Amanita phalloides]|nr:hypothetical protein APHAL10511_003352 [Amanita phalloides]
MHAASSPRTIALLRVATTSFSTLEMFSGPTEVRLPSSPHPAFSHPLSGPFSSHTLFHSTQSPSNQMDASFLSAPSIIVASKHSVGIISVRAQSRAKIGEAWLRLYLAQKGKTEQELAKTFWDNRWTTISELCDDSFEEHVLPYPPDKRGLFTFTESIHAPRNSLPSPVDGRRVCRRVGVHQDKIYHSRLFHKSARSRNTQNRHMARRTPRRLRCPHSHYTASTRLFLQNSTPPGSTFFFKFKYDEPYLMYRDWREVTKSLLSIKSKSGRMYSSNLPKSKMRRPETIVYVNNWVIKEINQNLEAFQHYQNNKGIIKAREVFLERLASN